MILAKEFGDIDPIQRTLSFNRLNETPERTISLHVTSLSPSWISELHIGLPSLTMAWVNIFLFYLEEPVD